MTLTILSLEDEADVRDALERDLEQFWDKIRLEVAEDVDDAWSVIDEIVEDGDELALVLSDHRLPGKSGVDFLVELTTSRTQSGRSTRPASTTTSPSRGTPRSCARSCEISSPNTSSRPGSTPCPT